MESILEDIPTPGQSGFNPFIDPAKDIEEPPEADNPHEEAPQTEDLVQDQDAEAPAEPLAGEEEDPAVGLQDLPADEEAPTPEALPNEPEPETETEIIYNQVEGPKVEVVTVKEEVRKIIVHLAPDNILEIDCEY